MTKSMTAPVLLALLALAACGGPRMEWTKDGADASQLRQDRDSCANESGGYRFMDDSRGQDADAANRRNSADLYRLCMESRGWKRQRTQPAK
jgi:hypothetical protein